VIQQGGPEYNTFALKRSASDTKICQVIVQNFGQADAELTEGTLYQHGFIAHGLSGNVQQL
jgi:hypothetical protein